MLEGVYQNLNYSSPADATSHPSSSSFQPFTSMKSDTPSPPSALKHTETPTHDDQDYRLRHPQQQQHQQQHTYAPTHYPGYRDSYYRGYYGYPSTYDSAEMYPRQQQHLAHNPLDPSPSGNVETTSPTSAAWPSRPMRYSWNSPPTRPLAGVNRGDETRLDMNIPRGPLSPPLAYGQTSRPKLTTTLWEDENTICYQVDAKGICVARRADTDMINGTKLLNVVGMSRGKRDGILKNEKGRLVIKVGAMHLKGVWIELRRAKFLATKFRIQELLYPLLEDNPSQFIYSANNPSAAMLPGCSPRNDPSAALSTPPGSTVDSSSSRRLSHTLPDNNSDTYSHHSWKEQQQRPPSLPIPSIESKLNAVKREPAPPHYGSGYGAEPDASSILPTPQPSSNNASGYTGLNYYYRHYDYVHRPLQALRPLASPDSDGKPATIEDSCHYRNNEHYDPESKQHIKTQEKHD